MASTEKEPALHSRENSHRPRPGGRTAATRDRIAAAVVDLLVERGVEECTFTNIAAKAGVERSTLYRRYENRWAMISEALFAFHAVDFAVEATGDFRADMTTHLGKVAASLDSRSGKAMVVAAAMARAEESPAGGQYWRRRREQLQPIVDAAVRSGQVWPSVDPDELFAASDGPLFFRLLIASAPIDQAFIGQVVDNLVRLYVREGGKAAKETAS
jgi:AcrR family transcriptional regulator